MTKQGSMPRYGGVHGQNGHGGYIDIIETTGSQPTVTDPDPGNDFSFTMPDTEIWEILGFSITFTTDGNTADRIVRIEFLGPDGHRLFVVTFSTKNKNETVDLILAQWGHDPDDITISGGTDVSRAAIPRRMMLPPGCTIRTQTENLQTGDDFSNPHIHVERFGH